MAHRRAHTLCLAVLSAFACSDPQFVNPHPSPSEPDASIASLSLEPSTTISLAPGSSIEVFVAVEPPGNYVIRFMLLGDSLDASLDASRRQTSDDGKTSVLLNAPGSPAAFRLGATAGSGANAEVAVSVRNLGLANLRVSPSYKGLRNTPSWTASAVAGVKCTEIPGEPHEDGPIVGVAVDGDPVLLDSLPVGPIIAVTMRSNSSVGGCTELADLAPDETRGVTVPVYDMPVRIADTRLHIKLSISSDGGELRPLFDELTESFLYAAFPTDIPTGTTLLDAIQSLLSATDEFEIARQSMGWDAIATAWLDVAEHNPRDHIRAWIRRGLQPLYDGELLSGLLTAAFGSGTLALLSLDSFYGIPIVSSGVPQNHIVSMSVEPGDTMLSGGKITWLPSRLIGAAGDNGAREIEGLDSAHAALSHIVNCNGLTSQLVAGLGVSLSCDKLCLETVCDDAINRIWSRSCNHSGLSLNTVQSSFAVSGTAAVNGYASIEGLDATWVGTMVYNASETLVRGSAIGTPDTE